MNIEDKFNQEIWWILQQLKHLILYSKENEILRYAIEARPILPQGTPPPKIQNKAILKLEEWEAIKIIESKILHVTYGKDFVYFLKILQPKFDILYKKYELRTVTATNNESKQETSTSLKEIIHKGNCLLDEVGSLMSQYDDIFKSLIRVDVVRVYELTPEEQIELKESKYLAWNDSIKNFLQKNKENIDSSFNIVFYEKNNIGVNVRFPKEKGILLDIYNHTKEKLNRLNELQNIFIDSKLKTSSRNEPENKKTHCQFNKDEKITILKLGELKGITFTKTPALIVKFFYDSSNYDNKCKNYKEFNKKFELRLKSKAFSDKIKDINKIVLKNTSNTVSEIISKEEKIRVNSLNHFKWEIKA